MRSAQQREPGSHPHLEPGWLLALFALGLVMITVGGVWL